MPADLSLDSRLAVAEFTLVQDFSGELTILNTDAERYFSLDDVGARMWKAIDQTSTLREAHAQLVETFGIAPERIEQDLLNLAADLVRTGLVTVERA